MRFIPFVISFVLYDTFIMFLPCSLLFCLVPTLTNGTPIKEPSLIPVEELKAERKGNLKASVNAKLLKKYEVKDFFRNY